MRCSVCIVWQTIEGGRYGCMESGGREDRREGGEEGGGKEV